MKKLFLTSVLLCFSVVLYSQADTLYTKTQKKMPCKIVEISESDIRYKILENLDGPIYVISVSKVYKYTLSNGYSEMLLPDELSVEFQHASIMNSKSVVKVQPFSFVNNQISIAYEQVIKTGINLDVELGYINNSITEESSYYGTTLYSASGKPAFCTGVYLKPGVKFMIGQDYSLKGMKYAHPLKGRYIKLDLAVSFMNFQNVTYITTPYPYTYYPIYYNNVSDVNTMAYGGFVNYGRQFILGNILTLEYYLGLGLTGQADKYYNTSTTIPNQFGYNSYYSSEAKYIGNYHAFYRWSEVGLSFTAGFRVGYIIPEKKPNAVKQTIKE